MRSLGLQNKQRGCFNLEEISGKLVWLSVLQIEKIFIGRRFRLVESERNQAVFATADAVAMNATTPLANDGTCQELAIRKIPNDTIYGACIAFFLQGTLLLFKDAVIWLCTACVPICGYQSQRDSLTGGSGS